MSDSAFVRDGASEPGEDEAECDIIVESNGFRVNKAATLRLGSILSFLVDVREVLGRRAGKAEFLGSGGRSFDRLHLRRMGEDRVRDERPEGG